MAILLRGRLVFGLVTLLVCLFLTNVSQAGKDAQHECDKKHPNGGSECRKDSGDVGLNDDIDDTFKVVKNVRISLSESGLKPDVLANNKAASGSESKSNVITALDSDGDGILDADDDDNIILGH